MRQLPPSRCGVLAFFGLTFAFSWSFWLPLTTIDSDFSILGYLALGVGAAGPSLAGVICTAWSSGRTGLHDLFKSIFHLRTPVHWYVLASTLPIIIALAAMAIHRVSTGLDTSFYPNAALVALVPVWLILGLATGPIQEELGWRGYALPRLLDRLSSLQASLLLGTVWAIWHLPLYAIKSEKLERAPLIIFLISVVALAVHYTWLWKKTSQNLFIALIFHSSINIAAFLLLSNGEDRSPFIVATGLTVILAVFVGIDLKRGDAHANGRQH